MILTIAGLQHPKVKEKTSYAATPKFSLEVF